MNTDERPRLGTWAAALIFTGAAVSFSAAGGADTRIVGVVGSKEKTIENLSLQVNALEMRVKKLEAGLIAVQRTVNKPDSPDDGGGSDKPDKKGGKNGNASGQGANDSGSAGSNQSGSGSAGSNQSGAASTQGDNSGALKDVTPNASRPSKASANSDIPTMTVRAPFRVVDSAGKAILQVYDPPANVPEGGRGVYIYGPNGANIALTTVATGGRLFINTDGDTYSLSLGAVSDGAAVKFRAARQLRAFAGLDTRGRGLFSVYGSDGDQPLAGLQTSDQGKGLIAVFNANKPVAFLTQSGAHPGGGNLTVTDPGGNGVFSAGYDGESGSACVNHKQSLHCLGIGLPLGGGQ